MKISELSAEDQALLNTKFSPELEKEAGEQVKVAQELYSTGFSKFAAETVEALEKLAEEGEHEPKEDDDKEHEKKLNEEQKKEASARGAFIAKGYIDGLKKLGQEKYQDENAYLYPFINEKLASMGKQITDFAAKHTPAAKALAGKAVAAAKTPAATHTAAALGGAAGLKGLQMMGRKKD